MTQAIEGKVENGSRVQIQFGKFTGVGGIREREGHLEVAYFGEPPAKFPVVGLVDGAEATAIGRATGQISRGFTVLIVTLA